ncbi:MAG: OmpA family protein [Pseudomonadota bacterium]|nr:OmpA family protein [Pseudomonadota bacterium]
MRKLKIMTAAIATMALTGCAGWTSLDSVDEASNASTVGNAFTKALAIEYQDLAEFEQFEMFDYRDAERYAQKAIRAAGGEEVRPEHLDEWVLPLDHVIEIAQARKQLFDYFDKGIRSSHPNLSAKAQAMFDCWVEQQEENFQWDHINSCKIGFHDALDKIDAAMHPKKAIPKKIKPAEKKMIRVPAIPQTKMKEGMFLVFFDWDKADITEAAAKVLDTVTAEVNKGKIMTINIIGHADTSGPDFYNMSLSKKRAEAVMKALIARGMSVDMISTNAKGEKDLMVPTADGVREPANRRSEIKFK